MKYFFLIVILVVPVFGFSQGGLPESFFNGKSIVLVSADPGARPVMDWKAVADSVHLDLVAAGADPVAYYELEQVALSEEVQTSYAKAFSQRLIKNIIFVTRQRNGGGIHVGEFSGTGKLINSTSLYGIQGSSIEEAADQFAALGESRPSQNLLVIDVPEFPGNVANEAAQNASANRFLPRNPLNLEMFKLGVPIEGSSAQTGLISYFRYDLYGKSAEAILAEQKAQKSQIESILNGNYPNDVAWLTEARSDEELIKDKVQFLLVKVEGREADLKRSMGVEANPSENQTVVKYYIRLIVRDELYIGPEWDADPDWRVSLRNFITNLKK
ncbi:NTPase [Algoriphagus sp. PAP.12]|uniref:NTPase n=1 Tax=Algoriphagus sp. PAP.12 TaxID=2996678 RepID=UPI00227C5B4A|nr:NTPase [Algoriphagus sp. PAP.12]